MLGKAGTGEPVNDTTSTIDDVRGYQYYRGRLDDLAKHFADTMNTLNEKNGKAGDVLLANKENPDEEITALNIGISKGWTSGDVHISTGGENSTDTILAMMNAMKESQPELGNKSFADYINNTATILANDSKTMPIPSRPL